MHAIESKIGKEKIEERVGQKREVVPQTPSPKPQASRVKMPAKKSTATVTATVQPSSLAAAVPTAVPVAVQPIGFQPGSLATEGFQFVPGMVAPQFAMGMSPTFSASIPMAQAVAIPEPAQMAVNPIELMEAQMKAMKDYIASMEKTFKEAKKGMKKPRIAKDPNAPKNPIPEGTQAWNDFVVLVQKEESDRIRAADTTKAADWKGITRKEAMAKAKELKAAGDPRYNYVKKEKAGASAAPAPSAPGAAVEAKKRGRKPKNAAALPAPGLPPTVAGGAFAQPASLPASEEGVEVEEIVIIGVTYLMTAKKECWRMLPNGEQGEWAGIYNGSIIVPAPEPL